MPESEAILLGECRYLAKQVLFNNGADSTDVVDTLANRFLEIAQDHQQFVREQRDTDLVIAHAVRYIADVHAMPPHGTDTVWFRHTLAALLELAVPNTGLTGEAAKLLPSVQEGIAESLSDAPISRHEVRVEDEDAKVIKSFEKAGCDHGVVSDLLDLVDHLYHGDTLSEQAKRLFRVASIAAPMTRQARLDAGLDGG